MKFTFKLILSLLFLLPFLLFFSGLAYQFSGYSIFAGKPYDGLGLQENGRLDTCPNKPLSEIRKQENCVSTEDSSDTEYYLEPIQFQGDALEISAVLFNFIQKNRSWDLIKQDDNYYQVAVHSDFFGFVDDLELQIEENKVNFRSSSRLGFKDFEANKKHIDTLRTLLSSSSANP